MHIYVPTSRVIQEYTRARTHACHVIMKSLPVADGDSSFVPGETISGNEVVRHFRWGAMRCATVPVTPHGELLTKQHALQLVKTKILASCKAHHLQIKMWNTVLQFKLYNIIISMLLRCEKIKSWKIFSTYTVVLLFSISVWGVLRLLLPTTVLQISHVYGGLAITCSSLNNQSVDHSAIYLMPVIIIHLTCWVRGCGGHKSSCCLFYSAQ